MKGRAGRKGKDTVGESYLVCRRDDFAVAKQVMEAKMPSVKSCLDGDEGGLKRYIPFLHFLFHHIDFQKCDP